MMIYSGYHLKGGGDQCDHPAGVHHLPGLLCQQTRGQDGESGRVACTYCALFTLLMLL